MSMRKIFIIDNKKAILTNNNTSIQGVITQIHELNELEDTAIDRMSVEEDLFAYCNDSFLWRFKISTDDDMADMFDVITRLGKKMSYIKVEFN